MDFEYSPRTKELQAQLLRFMDEHIYPAEQRYEDEIAANTKAGKRWTPLQTIEELKPKARAQGLWNLFLPPTAGGKGREGERSRLRPVERRLRAAGRDHGPHAAAAGTGSRALRARLRLELLDRLQRRPALAGLGVGFELVLVALLGGIDVVVHEAQQLRLQLLGLGEYSKSMWSSRE